MGAIILIGASFAEPGTPIAAELERVLGREVIAVGIRGATLREWSSPGHQAGWALLPSSAEVLVLEMGGNGPVDVADVVRAHAALEARFSAVQWVLPPRWGQTGVVAERRATAARAIEAANVPSIDPAYSASSTEISRDGTHLTVYGYTRFARRIAAQIGPEARARKIATIAGIVGGVLSLVLVAVHLNRG